MDIELRSAIEEDKNLLFKWRNDEDVKRWSFDTKEVSFEEHEKWFETALQRKDVEIFIVESEGIPVGQVRLTYWYDEMVIGYSIDRNYRGNHLGQKSVEKMEYLIKDNPIIRKDGEYFVAYVKKDNIVSRKVFQVLNYKEEEQRKWIKYIKKIEG